MPGQRTLPPRPAKLLTLALTLVTLAVTIGCSEERDQVVVETGIAPAVRALEPPVAASSFAPDLTADGDATLMTWLERSGERGHQLRFSRYDGSAWSAPSTVAEGKDFFANWADFPAVVRAGDGALIAHWLAKTGSATYAYSIFLARSDDGGLTWQPLGKLNDDATDTEHGFVSWVPEGDGARAFWLDGRAMEEGEPMALRTALVGREVEAAEVLDPRVCECCSTAATRTASGPLVAVRDRSAEEIRDIAWIRRAAGGWSQPELVHADGWKIDGCPVNGPALAAAGERAALAWFTAAAGNSAVAVAFFEEEVGDFGPRHLVDDSLPMGRVDVVATANGAWVSWLDAGPAGAGEGDAEDAVVALRWVGAGGEMGEPIALAPTSASRKSGFPRLAKAGDRLRVAWVELEGESRRVRMAELAAAEPLGL